MPTSEPKTVPKAVPKGEHIWGLCKVSLSTGDKVCDGWGFKSSLTRPPMLPVAAVFFATIVKGCSDTLIGIELDTGKGW